MLAIWVPAVRQITMPKENVILVAPPLPEYKPKPIVRPLTPVPKPKLEPVRKRLPEIKPPVVKPPEMKPMIAAAPVIRTVPVTAPPVPEPKLEPPAPKPEIKTGVFETSEQAKGPQIEKQVKTGGFGDPRGVPASTNSRESSLAMAKVGSFDLPDGSGKGGANGRGQSGGVRAGIFGDAGPASAGSAGNGTGHGGPVQTGAFGDSTPVAQSLPQRARAVEPVTTPVEILYKPKPVYTEEGRSLKIEGQVAIQVVFLSTGSIRVVRILHGLGHGLDEAAEQAALQVRFRPATRGGVPVDTNATIYITFELT
jgi:TonB family protein